MSFAINILALSIPIFTLQVYDRVISHNATSTLVALVSGVLLAVLFDAAIRMARGRVLQKVSQNIDARIGKQLYEKIYSIPLAKLEGKTSNFWQSLWADLGMIRGAFSGSSAILFCDLPFALIFLGVIFVIAEPVAWIVLAFTPIFAILAVVSNYFVQKANNNERGSQLLRDSITAELTLGRMTAKSLNIAPELQNKWEMAHVNAIDNATRRGNRVDFGVSLGHSLSMLLSISVISAGALAIIDGNMTMGGLIATNMLASKVISPFNQLISGYRSIAGAKKAISRLSTIFAMEEELMTENIEGARPSGRLTAENVTYRYVNDNGEESKTPLIDNLTISASCGKLYAIIGGNGSGKTTLIKLLQGLYQPENGRITLDGADIAQYSRAQLSSWIGYVPQECVLFSGSIRDNIAITAPNISDEAILRAATLSGADAFIRTLPKGYDTQVGEGGSRLSGGQRQRIAIARAMLKSPPILLLDEVTSHLDSRSTLEIVNMLKSYSEKHTVIAITHSPLFLRNCDQIFIMEKGKITLQKSGQEVRDSHDKAMRQAG